MAASCVAACQFVAGLANEHVATSGDASLDAGVPDVTEDATGDGGDDAGDGDGGPPAMGRCDVALDMDAGLGGLELWLRACDLPAGPVTAWPDQSAHHRTAVPTPADCTASLAATDDAGGGNPAVVFPGTAGGCLAVPSMDLDFSAGLSLYVAVQTHPTFSGTGAADPFLRLGTSLTGVSMTIALSEWRDNLLSYRVAGMGLGSDAADPPFVRVGEWHVYAVVQSPADADGGASAVVSRDDIASFAGTFPAPAAGLRSANYLGRGPVGWLHGDIGEMLLFSRALDATEDSLVRSRLMTRWHVQP